jgi:hypothetical protein
MAAIAPNAAGALEALKSPWSDEDMVVDLGKRGS